MFSGTSTRALREEGFQSLGEQAFRVTMRAWWHPEDRIQLLEVPVPGGVLVKGSKSYRVVAITEEGVTWARDVGPLHDYLEAHFPDLHLGFSFFRDLTPAVARRHVDHQREVETPRRERVTGEHLSHMQEQLRGLQAGMESLEGLRQLLGDQSGLLAGHVRDELSKGQAACNRLAKYSADIEEQSRWEQTLLRRYLEQGSGACLRFTVGSLLHVTESEEASRDAVRAIRKELADLHRYQVSQKLAGGRLNVQVVEEVDPHVRWLEEVLGVSLSPRELARLAGKCDALQAAGESRLMVTPDMDFVVDGAKVVDRCLVAARSVSALMERADRPDRGGDGLQELARKGLGAFLGMQMDGEKLTSRPCFLPLDRLNHVYVSGTTGSGKSYAGRVLTEEACLHGLNVLCLDPRNQMAGLKVAEDRPEVLARGRECGREWKGPRGFDIEVHAPAMDLRTMPKNLAELAKGQHVVSLKGLEDRERCEWFARILDAVFEVQAEEEAEGLKFLLVIEESQRFTKKKVGPEAKEAAERAERALDRTVREARKFGCCVVIISQTIRDFAYDSASIRQNTNTKMFLHNSDREVEYAATFLEDGKRIVKLQPGTAVIFHPEWGDVLVRIRAPYSKVWEFSAEATAAFLLRNATEARPISEEAASLFAWISKRHQQTGQGIPLTEAAEALGLSSRRRLYGAMRELEAARRIRTRRLQERGRPRIVVPLSSEGRDERVDEERTESRRLE